MHPELYNWLQERKTGRFHRQLLVVSGEEQWCLNTAQQILDELNADESLDILSCGCELGHSTTTNKHYQQELGREFSGVVYNCHRGLRANAFAALSGVVQRFGLMLLLTPDLNEWSQTANPEHKNRISYGYIEQLQRSFFQESLVEFIRARDDVITLTSENFKGVNKSISADCSNLVVNEPTSEQKSVIEKIQKVALGHRNRPLVITADRGRGKSASIGFAVETLLQENRTIVITAPKRAAVETLFKHAGVTPEEEQNLEFRAIDDLILNKPDANLVIVDEAAALPADMLLRLVDYYPRIVFATTTDGYEGSGRGFEIRFKPSLVKKRPETRFAQLETPIRWFPDDCLEATVWQMLHLRSSYNKADKSAASEHSQMKFEWVDKSTLVAEPCLTNQIFNLLTDAHYQTTPDDLMSMLDAPEQKVFCVRSNQLVIGVALVNLEGNFDQDVSDTILTGERRFQGHMLAQQCAQLSCNPRFAKAKYARVVRIAVLAEQRNRGLGSEIIQQLIHWCEQENIDFIGTSFGLNKQLLRFWHSNDFQSVHVGTHKNAASGEFNVQMLRSVNRESPPLADIKKQMLGSALYHLNASLKNLDSGCVLMMLSNASESDELPEDKIQRLNYFATYQRALNYILPDLVALLVTKSFYLKTPPEQQHFLCDLALKRLKSNVLCEGYGLTGEKQLLSYTRDCVKSALGLG